MYVIRANDLKEVDGALSLLNLDAPAKLSDAGQLINFILENSVKHDISFGLFWSF